MSLPYPNPYFLSDSDRMLHGYGCEYRFFRMSEMIWRWSGIGSGSDLNTRIIYAYIENYMLINN